MGRNRQVMRNFRVPAILALPPRLGMPRFALPRLFVRRTPLSVRVIFSVLFACFADLGAFGADTGDQPMLSIFSRTWPSGYSEIEWWQGGQKFRALTNIDCTKLPMLLDFDVGAEKVSMFTISTTVGEEEVAVLRDAGSVDASGFPSEWPKLDRLPIAGAAQYLFGWERDYSSNEKESAVRWLDALHRHYELHRSEILAAWQARQIQKPVLESLAKQREERLRLEAKAPPTQLRVIAIEGVNKPVPVPLQIPTTEGSRK